MQYARLERTDMHKGCCVIAYPITCGEVINELTDLFGRFLNNERMSEDDEASIAWIKSEWGK
jgi:hypothetical protein